MRNEKKLVMFDFGGVVELHDHGDRERYDYKAVICNAVRYAVGSKHVDMYGYSLHELDEMLWERIVSDERDDRIMVGCSTKREFVEVFGNLLCDIGNISHSYVEHVCERFLRYVHEYNRRIPCDMDMVRIQRRLREECLVGGMSNISYMWSPRFHKFVDFIEYDVVWESFKMGFTKPDLAAYRSVEAMTGLEPCDILLIDDTLENVRGAIDAGWCAWRYEDCCSIDKIRRICTDFLSENKLAMPSLTSYEVQSPK